VAFRVAKIDLFTRTFVRDERQLEPVYSNESRLLRNDAAHRIRFLRLLADPTPFPGVRDDSACDVDRRV
jgi:hypothetical protein